MHGTVSVTANELPQDAASLRELALRLQHELEETTRKVEESAQQLEARDDELRILREYIRLLKHHRFGRKSERLSDDQLWIFDEAEAADDDPVAVPAHTRRKRGRKPLPAWIPRVEVLHDLPEAEKRCGTDGTALERIGEETYEQLEFIPATLRVLRHVRPKYACPACRSGIHTAPVPLQPIPKSLASPTLLAHVAVSKYADGLPLYRQEQMFTRLGITFEDHNQPG